ncbi:MAG: beta-lactamase family protein [Holophagales bacterium]|nr:beta-lactamase family protein [Holophagales bacterium]
MEGERTVYSHGFGYRHVRRGQPVTPTTLFRVGGLTRPLSATMLGALADADVFEWRGTGAESESIHARLGHFEDLDAVRPRSAEPDAEDSAAFVFSEVAWGPEAARRHVAFASAVGEVCRLAAPGQGAIAAFRALMHETLFGPVGMVRSAVASRLPAVGDDYAMPYGIDAEGRPVEADFPELSTTAAADGAASTVEDLARFVVLHLQDGITPAGQRVVSPVNLAVAHGPSPGLEPRPCHQRPLAERCVGGVGWVEMDLPRRIGGLPDGGGSGSVHAHGVTGGLDGFSGAMIYLDFPPVGLVVLTNMDPRLGGLAFVREVRDAFLVQVLGVEAPASYLDEHLRRIGEIRAVASAAQKVERSRIAPWRGPWSGDWRVDWRDGHLLLSRSLRSFELGASGDDFVVVEGPHIGTRVRFEAGRPRKDDDQLAIRDPAGRFLGRVPRMAPGPAGEGPPEQGSR